MSETQPSNSSNLTSWQPGQSGNPAGSSERARARAAARRISGLAPALRELLDQTVPGELLATLTDEQRAALDGSESLAEFLAARLVAAAASAKSPAQLLESLKLIGTLDAKQGAAGPPDLERLLARMPRHLRTPLQAAFDALDEGEDPWWAFEKYFHSSLDEATKQRLFRACMGEIDLRNIPPAVLARYVEALPEDDQAHLKRIYAHISAGIMRAVEELSDDDRETLDRVQTELRSAPYDEQIEAMMNGELESL